MKCLETFKRTKYHKAFNNNQFNNKINRQQWKWNKKQKNSKTMMIKMKTIRTSKEKMIK